MATREAGTYREGDLIRVVNKQTGEGFQTRLRKCPDPDQYQYRDTLFLSKVWVGRWQTWTFLDWWLSDKDHTIELVEAAAPDPVPTDPGLYRDKVGYLWVLKDDEKWYFEDGGDGMLAAARPEDYLPLTRLYTKEDVSKLLRRVAYGVDPDYEYDARAANFVKEMEGRL